MINLQSIPLDDPAAFKILNDGKFCGIFQFEGKTLQGLCRSMTIESLDDMIAITALSRPGPMDSGSTEHWIKRRISKEEITYHHPSLEPILKGTLGVITFQEQCMAIGRELGKFSWEDVSSLRKAIGKSQGAEIFNIFGEKWKVGTISNGIDAKIADQIWSELITFGRYGFVKAHATAYSIISYNCCYLKAHFPLEYSCAVLDGEPDPEKQIALLRELAQEGVAYKAVDADHSTDRWSIATKDGKRILVGPLTAIKGIGPATLIEITEARKNNQPLRAKLAQKLAEAKTEIDTLFPISATIKRICPDLKAKKITTAPTPIADATPGREVMVIGVLKKVEQINENTPERVLRRGREVYPSNALNLFIADDSGELFAKVHARSFDPLGLAILEKAKPGKSIFALKGSMSPHTFKMLWISNARHIGDA